MPTPEAIGRHAEPDGCVGLFAILEIHAAKFWTLADILRLLCVGVDMKVEIRSESVLSLVSWQSTLHLSFAHLRA